MKRIGRRTGHPAAIVVTALVLGLGLSRPSAAQPAEALVDVFTAYAIPVDAEPGTAADR